MVQSLDQATMEDPFIEGPAQLRLICSGLAQEVIVQLPILRSRGITIRDQSWPVGHSLRRTRPEKGNGDHLVLRWNKGSTRMFLRV